MEAVSEKWTRMSEHLWLKRMLRPWITTPVHAVGRALYVERTIQNLGRGAVEYSLAAIRASKCPREPSESCMLDCTYVRFCAGPCSDRLTETAPDAEFPRVFLLPRAPGTSFPMMRYTLHSGVELVLSNARVCRRCFLEFCAIREMRVPLPHRQDKQHSQGMRVWRKLCTEAVLFKKTSCAA